MINRLIKLTTEYFSADARRIQHFMKVYGYASFIGEQENCSNIDVLKAAAVVHDVGIKKAEEIFGYNDGRLQEQYGPGMAEPLLREAGYDESEIARIKYLVAHHHTYSNMDGLDYRILVEADFLVNLYEDNASMEAITAAYNRIFTTATGKWLCKTIYGLKE